MEENELIITRHENDGGRRKFRRLAKSKARMKKKICRDREINEKRESKDRKRKGNKEKKIIGKEKEEEDMGPTNGTSSTSKETKNNKKN